MSTFTLQASDTRVLLLPEEEAMLQQELEKNANVKGNGNNNYLTSRPTSFGMGQDGANVTSKRHR